MSNLGARPAGSECVGGAEFLPLLLSLHALFKAGNDRGGTPTDHEGPTKERQPQSQ